MDDDRKSGKVAAAGVEFTWLHDWCSYADADHDPFGDLYGTLRAETPPGQWSPKKEPIRTGNTQLRKRVLLFLLWSIYQENEHAIPEAVWDARQELEREIVALPESAL